MLEAWLNGDVPHEVMADWCEEQGLSPAPAYFALRAQRLMHDSGVTREHLAQVSLHELNLLENAFMKQPSSFSCELIFKTELSHYLTFLIQQLRASRMYLILKSSLVTISFFLFLMCP